MRPNQYWGLPSICRGFPTGLPVVSVWTGSLEVGNSSVTGDPVGRSSIATGEAEVTEEVGEAEVTEEEGESEVTEEVGEAEMTETVGVAEVTEEEGESEVTEEVGVAEVTEEAGNLVGRPSIEKGAFVGAGTGLFVTTPADGLLGITRLTGFVVGLLTGFFEDVNASVGFLVGRRYCRVMAESFISCSLSGRY